MLLKVPIIGTALAVMVVFLAAGMNVVFLKARDGPDQTEGSRSLPGNAFVV